MLDELFTLVAKPLRMLTNNDGEKIQVKLADSSPPDGVCHGGW